MIFTVLILALLWVFQFFFLKSYYQTMKVREIKKAGVSLASKFGTSDYYDRALNVAYTSNASVEVTDSAGRSLYSVEMNGNQSLIHSNYGANLFKWRKDIDNSISGEIAHIVTDSVSGTEMIVYGVSVGSKDNPVAYVFLCSSLEPVSSTIGIIKTQLIYITIIIFELAFIITMYISKRLSRPIVEITNSTKEFAKGNYNVSFNGGDYLETQELADVLNNAEKEISKVDGLRRDLISNISHDLRTPLTIIKGYAEMIRDLSGDNKEKREEHLDVIIKESDRLSELVNGVLELSKLESGTEKLEYSAFEIHDFINDIMSRYKVYEETKGYTINIILDEDVVVKADRKKLMQVMYNFVNNAVNYTGEDKVVTVRQINKKDAVRIEITDTGKGIEKENLPLIFDRYYREKKTEREVVGTGLGLSIVKEILKKHNFRFGVMSKVGKGSTFWFEITR